MSVLNRYLLRRALFMLFVLLLAGMGVFVLSDLFQRLDVFMDADYPPAGIALYFIIRLPMIASQILPAVFLLAMTLQLSLMNKQRESLALQAGGIAPSAFFRFVFIYGLFWSCAQFACAQVLGVAGEKRA
ncbi:MAG: LptF/LptG family permease, partial [Deltaproteobacteria bacterium]|nr:LptF/LptG family permease [Deltaproteobacteria bacterium]